MALQTHTKDYFNDHCIAYIAVGEEFPDLLRIQKAVEKAHLGDLVASLEGGIATTLGNNNDGLSGGQLQRVGLARALYPEPALVVMDEATSALDAESEYEIGQALSELRGKVTVVLIAHRLNTVQHADIVFLVDKGKVVDSGTFSSIRSRNPNIARAIDLMSIH